MSHDAHHNDHGHHEDHGSEHNYFDGGGVAGVSALYMVALLAIITWLLVWG